MPWMYMTIDIYDHYLVTEDETASFMYPSSSRAPPLDLQRWRSQNIISTFPIVEFPSYTPYISLATYMNVDESRFIYVEEAARHFKFVVDDMTHQGLSYHGGDYMRESCIASYDPLRVLYIRVPSIELIRTNTLLEATYMMEKIANMRDLTFIHLCTKWTSHVVFWIIYDGMFKLYKTYLYWSLRVFFAIIFGLFFYLDCLFRHFGYATIYLLMISLRSSTTNKFFLNLPGCWYFLMDRTEQGWMFMFLCRFKGIENIGM